MTPMVELLRRFAVDWIDRADTSAALAIMDENYALGIGDLVLQGRQEYVAATAQQLELFPHLAITVHDIAVGESFGAIAFTEHGPSRRHDLAAAAWRGVAIFWAEGGKLVRCVTEEDYLSRKRQLATGRTEVVESPAAAPWAEVPRSSNPAAEVSVREWLGAKGLELSGPVVLDDGTPLEGVEAVDHSGITLTVCESAGNKVAFRGSLPCTLVDQLGEASITFAGLVQVNDGDVTRGWVVRDRLGLQRRQHTLAKDQKNG